MVERSRSKNSRSPTRSPTSATQIIGEINEIDKNILERIRRFIFQVIDTYTYDDGIFNNILKNNNTNIKNLIDDRYDIAKGENISNDNNVKPFYKYIQNKLNEIYVGNNNIDEKIDKLIKIYNLIAPKIDGDTLIRNGNGQNLFLRRDEFLGVFVEGGSMKHTYNGRAYKVYTGKRGGKYIVVGKEKKKIYI